MSAIKKPHHDQMICQIQKKTLLQVRQLLSDLENCPITLIDILGGQQVMLH